MCREHTKTSYCARHGQELEFRRRSQCGSRLRRCSADIFSSLPPFRSKALLQWPPQTRDFETERAALGKVLHQEVMFQDAPEMTWKRGSVKQPKASLQRRPGHQESSSSPSSSGGQAGGRSSGRAELSREGSRQHSHDCKKTKRIGEAEEPGRGRGPGDVSPEEGVEVWVEVKLGTEGHLGEADGAQTVEVTPLFRPE